MRTTLARLWRGLSLAAAACLLLGAPAAQATTSPPGSGWIEIAHFDGTQSVTAATYLSGTGSLASANFAQAAGLYAGLGDQFTLGLVMGSVIDYYRPASPATDLADMLTSNHLHLWSASLSGSFIAPVYSTAGQLGGSAFGWPGDGRLALSFWGTTTAQPGGCCQSAPGAPVSWGQAFSLYLMPISAVPEPGTWLLMGTGLMGLLLRRALGTRPSRAA